MDNEYSCPLIEIDVDETICYDIQMVVGPGNLINRSILDDYGDLFDISKVSNDRAVQYCTNCPFNQLKQAAAIVEEPITA